MKQQISIVGTEGSGKTVLSTVWAKRMSSRTDESFLNAQGMETSMYVEKAWHSLNQGEWLPSTPPGQQFELQWNLHVHEQVCPVKLIDAAGQDLRQLFSEGYQSPNLSDQQRAILKYLQESSLVIIVVNLKHFTGESDYLKQRENELILKEVVDMFAMDSKHQDLSIVFTAWDQYGGGVEKKYGSFLNYIQKELSTLYNAARSARAAGDVVEFFKAAAVADTELKTREDGKTVRVPKPGFTSIGIDELSNWIIGSVQKSHEYSQMEELKQQKVEKEKQAEKEREETKQGCYACGCIVMIIAVIILFLFSGY